MQEVLHDTHTKNFGNLHYVTHHEVGSPTMALALHQPKAEPTAHLSQPSPLLSWGRVSSQQAGAHLASRIPCPT